MEAVVEYIRQHGEEIPFKSLQTDEMEPSLDERQRSMQQVLERDRGLFLSRWGRHLPADILETFQPYRDEYEVDFHLKQLLPTPVERHTKRSIIKNRRYEYLKRHLRGSTYFSDESMQQLDPVLYEHFIGQHLTDEERLRPYGEENNLVQRILGNMARDEAREQVQKQKEIENEQFEEEDEDSDDDEDEDEKMKDIDEEDIEEAMTFREEQRNELVRLLEERFLAGKDVQFDYEAVDQNEAYDNVAQEEQDIQDRYFDDEVSNSAPAESRPSVYTGELDY